MPLPPGVEGWVYFGYIQRAHGVRGELRVVAADGSSELPEGIEEIRLRTAERERVLRIRRVRPVHGAWLISTRELSTREQAREVSGWCCYVPEESLPPLDSGEFYVHELAGMAVIDQDANEIGKVEEVLNNSGQMLLRIGGRHGERLLPLVAATVRQVDRQRRQLWVRVPTGLWEAT